MTTLVNAILGMQANMKCNFNQELNEIRLHPDDLLNLKKACVCVASVPLLVGDETFNGIKIIVDSTIKPWEDPETIVNPPINTPT